MENKKIKLWKKVLIVIAIILSIFTILTLRKFIILNNLEKISRDIINNTNYYAELYSLQEDSVSVSKSYNKDSKNLTLYETFEANTPESRKVTVYNDENGQIGIIQSGENKIAILDGSMIGEQLRINAYSNQDMRFWTKIQLAVKSRITNEECFGKECYLIESAKGWKRWIEKDSGLILREINSNYVTEFNYEFNIVRDEDVLKPDISDCQIQEKD